MIWGIPDRWESMEMIGGPTTQREGPYKDLIIQGPISQLGSPSPLPASFLEHPPPPTSAKTSTFKLPSPLLVA